MNFLFGGQNFSPPKRKKNKETNRKQQQIKTRIKYINNHVKCKYLTHATLQKKFINHCYKPTKDFMINEWLGLQSDF